MDHKEIFQRKTYGLKGFDTFLNFSSEFLDFAYIYCFRSHQTYCDLLLITYV